MLAVKKWLQIIWILVRDVKPMLIRFQNFRELRKAMDFEEASEACIGNDYHSTPYVGLMPISKLRCLRNSFGFNPDVSRKQETDICGRFFRVNAIKDHSGDWREHGNGKEV